MEQLDRRKFIARTGIGAAAAGSLWLAPEILSPGAAFAGASCLVTGTTLAPSGTNPQWQVTSWAASGSYPAVSLSWAAATIGSPDPNTGNGTIRTPALTGYGIPNVRVFYFDFNDADSGEGGSVTFTFTQPVYNVTFRVWDIDRNVVSANANGYIDRINVTANAGVTVSAVATGATGTNPVVASTLDNTSTSNAYADYTLTGAVTTFTLTYTNDINGGFDGTRMFVGIGDLSFCR